MKTLNLSSHIFNNRIISSNTKIFPIHTENTTFQNEVLGRILKSTLTVGNKVSETAGIISNGIERNCSFSRGTSLG